MAKKNELSGIKILYNNINGLSSKKDSLTNILKLEQPDVVCLCETKLGKGEKWSIDEYEGIVSNYKKGKIGLSVAVRCGTFVSIEKVSEDYNNILSVRVSYPEITLRFIVCHGPQEDDEPEERQAFFENISVEIERGRASDEIPVVLGDMNAKISKKDSDLSADSFNGKLLKKMIEDLEVKVANFHENAIGSWTRIQRNKKGVTKSVLDYILVDETTYPKVSDLVIDEEKCITPFRTITRNKEVKAIHSDHCTISMTVSYPKGVWRKRTTKRTVWDFTAEGYEKFKNASEENVCVRKSESSNTYYERWLGALVAIMGDCFSKKTVGGSRKGGPELNARRRKIRRILQLEAKRGKIQRAVVKKYLKVLKIKEVENIEKKKAEKLKKTVSLLTETEKFSPQGYWKLKKSITTRANNQSVCVICDDNTEVSGEHLVKEEYRKEFEFCLRNRLPHKEWETYTENVNKMMEIWLNNTDHTETVPFTLEELKRAISMLKKGKAPGHDEIPSEIFLAAGTGILIELLKVLNLIKESKEIPEKWNWVNITTIFKNKGSRKELVNYRGIFLTVIVKKIFENMLKARMKDQLEMINKLQGGARSNRSPSDNLFLLYACIDHYKYMNKPLFMTAYDFEQAFDSLWLQDCIRSLQDLGVPNDILQLIYNLNKEAKFVVNTPFGPTSPTTVKDIVEQGTVLGPILCSSSTAEYCGKNTGVAVLDTTISSLLWVDDTADLSNCKSDAEESHQNAVGFGREKKSSYSKKKCKTMVINGKKDSSPPDLYIEEVKMEVAEKIVYLGDVVNSKGTNADLIEDRIQRGTAAMFRVEALVKEASLGIYTVSVHLLLYQSLLISSMTFNSQSWTNLKETEVSKLEKMQLKSLKKILQVPGSTANSFTFLEFGELPIRYVIDRNQINFLYHIFHLEDDDPVKKMWESQRNLCGEKNWWYAVSRSMLKYGISLDDVESKSKDSFKEYVKKKVKEVALMKLRDECNAKTKTKNILYDVMKPQEYLHKLYPKQAKAVFQARCQTLDIKEHRPYKYQDMLCRVCKTEEETLAHIVNCGVAKEIDTKVLYDFQERDYDETLKLINVATRIVNFLDNIK